MRVAEYKIIDYKIEQKIIPAQYDEEGNIITEEHTEEIKKPIYGMVYRNMTEAEMQEIPQPSVEEIKQQYLAMVDNYLDETVKTRGYDNILSACSYADDDTDKVFQAEGIACRKWRSLVYRQCLTILADVEAGKRHIPTEQELIAELPKLEW